ncbi:hypothetical protein KL86DES1_20378 [uncultured Desulfovibrio sp.]|uniref:Uncharacterized protein n=1 Tax=uncultured Desulfovibrio sp. TaxID=167968 RepID=A0A212L3F3_9BACT|nr:hypothetical protein KL86DES1_20378 [uncultured Desulfovibrio sp.]VZH33280.1 conserved protein of unknown function [Desulfovibrio sp. 86]
MSIFALNMPVINVFVTSIGVLPHTVLPKTKGKESRLFARCPSPVFSCHQAARPPLA